MHVAEASLIDNSEKKETNLLASKRFNLTTRRMTVQADADPRLSDKRKYLCELGKKSSEATALILMRLAYCPRVAVCISQRLHVLTRSQLKY